VKTKIYKQNDIDIRTLHIYITFDLVHLPKKGQHHSNIHFYTKVVMELKPNIIQVTRYSFPYLFRRSSNTYIHSPISQDWRDILTCIKSTYLMI